ncbi:MAG: hypothetical protein KA159_07790 [Halioglobus sp.]|nr:hypothetical protein [Halioglobus sp.]
MSHKTIAAAFALVASFGFTQAVTAAEEQTAASDTATVIVYRADEAINTKGMRIGVSANEHKFGRLSADDVVVAAGPAGEYTLGTSMSGTQPLTLDLKPGATYYVHAQLKMRGGRIEVTLEQVPEQVALSHQPELEGAI